jgi:hypothetical protein
MLVGIVSDVPGKSILGALQPGAYLYTSPVLEPASGAPKTITPLKILEKWEVYYELGFLRPRKESCRSTASRSIHNPNPRGSGKHILVNNLLRNMSVARKFEQEISVRTLVSDSHNMVISSPRLTITREVSRKHENVPCLTYGHH